MPEDEPHPDIPQWAEDERLFDLMWITENLDTLWPAAQHGFRRLGRGAVWVDTTITSPGEGHPYGYIPQSEIEAVGSNADRRMVAAYDPEKQLVTLLFKDLERVSTYQISVSDA